ncbi:putative archaeal serine protease [Nitrososphaera viennensis EN76]|nr:putative archaeal serine protease [Nitrososphaera viennensis EN76]
MFQYAFIIMPATAAAVNTRPNSMTGSPAFLMRESEEGVFASVDQLSRDHRHLAMQEQQPPSISGGSDTDASNNTSSPPPSSSPPTPARSQSIPFLTVVADQATSTVFPGSGQVLKLMIDVREGRGDILVNTNIFSGGLWQNSARIAASVAQSLTHVDLSSKEVILTIKSTNATESEEVLRKFGGGVDGPSAGGAMTVLLISELEGKAINNYTAMTGTINPDGTIGPVGGVIEKAVAAGKYGAKVMLVPAGQGYYPELSCKYQEPQPSSSLSSSSSSALTDSQICRLEQKPLSALMESRYGMRVIEIPDVQSALRYFQSDSGNGTTIVDSPHHQKQLEGGPP